MSLPTFIIIHVKQFTHILTLTNAARQQTAQVINGDITHHHINALLLNNIINDLQCFRRDCVSLSTCRNCMFFSFICCFDEVQNSQFGDLGGTLSLLCLSFCMVKDSSAGDFTDRRETCSPPILGAIGPERWASLGRNGGHMTGYASC